MHYDFYVYCLIDPDDNIPFYVGKGRLNRMYKHEKDVKNGKIVNLGNVEITDKIKKILSENKIIIYKKIEQKLSSIYALRLENQYIKKWGRLDINTGFLFNKTDGGEGTVNVSYETKEKISQSNKGRIFSVQHKMNLSKYAKNRTKEHLEKLSNSNKGKTKSDETKLKISKAKHHYYQNKENKIKAANRIKNITSDKNIKHKISTSLKQFYKNNPEYIQKLKVLGKQQSEKRKIIQDSKVYEFINPNGNVLKIKGLRKYCNENNLKYASMLRIYRGDRKTYKGYKKYECIGN